ncbi:mercury(II) reductase [Deinococcus sp. YIM 77859]|uniref:mercury(II) reductase n=1 Tax=Deinococcus sp. YIM 77859 TaxID=1540221 RepID=UPI00068A9E6B|nr:mercury(II) reductase [Deinococcus sp. YIM 77859]
MKRVDLAVLGGGSAGFAAAIRASDLGTSVALIEGSTIGGTCVNIGCVPSKTLIRAADTYHRAGHSAYPGVKPRGADLDYAAVIRQKDELVTNLRRGKYEDVLLEYPGITLLRGHATLTGPQTLRVDGETVHADKIIVATGSRPWVPDLPGLHDAGYWTSTEALAATELPESLIVIGGRYIAIELAQTFARFGTRVTLLQRSSHLLPDGEPEIGLALQKLLEAEGIEIHTNVQLQRVTREDKATSVHAIVNDEPRSFSASQLLMATGRHPHTRGFGLEDVGVTLGTRGALVVNESLQSSVPSIYAAGDVTGHAQYVYVAAYEGALAAENALQGQARELDLKAVPGVTFSDPAVATVGLTEAQAIRAGHAVRTSVLPMGSVPRSLANFDTRGLIKLVADASSTEILGAHILAPDAGEMIQPAVFAVKYGLTIQDFTDTLFPYLTHVEGLRLAARAFSTDPKKLSCCA